MVFITLGSQKFQFDRLLEAVDRLLESGVLQEEVFAQTGCSTYVPRHYKSRPFLDREEFAAITAEADLVITHGGTGAIIGAVKKGKKVIAVPRLARYGEHVDDHQLQIIDQFEDLDLICACRDCDRLEQALDYVRSHTFQSYRSNTQTIVDAIDRYLTENL